MKLSETEHAVLTRIRNSVCNVSEKVHQPKLRHGIAGSDFDDAVKNLADKMDMPFTVVRSLVTRLHDMRLIAYYNGRLIVAKHKIADAKQKATRRKPEIKVADPDYVVDTDYESKNALYEAQMFDERLEATYSGMDPFTAKAYEDMLRAELTAA